MTVESMTNDVLEGQRGISLLFSVFTTIKERFLRRIAVLGYDLILTIGMAILLVGSVLAMGGHVRIFQASVGLPLLCMTISLMIRAWRYPNTWREDIRHVLRDWVPFLIVVFIYENLHDVAGQVTDFDFAAALNRWDVALFGMEPTLWAQRFHSPVLTDLFSISYGLYFAFPLFIMFLLTIWDRRAELREMVLCLTIVFIMGFIGYVFLPASPPRYFIEHLYTDPVKLHGLFLFDRLQGAWDGLSVISGGAFPSLHVGISAVALIYAFRFRNINRELKCLWFAYIPLILSLWVSTVYLRHHWVIDIFAGWLVAALAYAAAVLMMRSWFMLRQRYGLAF